MAKVGMRHRENFNEIVGNLSRDAVRLTHPDRMAILAMNNKIFSDGLENHLEAQQPTQNPTQQVYNPPPPQTAPYVPAEQHHQQQRQQMGHQVGCKLGPEWD